MNDLDCVGCAIHGGYNGLEDVREVELEDLVENVDTKVEPAVLNAEVVVVGVDTELEIMVELDRDTGECRRQSSDISMAGEGSAMGEKNQRSVPSSDVVEIWQWKEKYGKWKLSQERRRRGINDGDMEDDDSEEVPNQNREVLFGVLWSVFMTGLQVWLNFMSVYLIKQTPGYKNVPLGHLALLFCCHPRLSWVALVLEHTGDKTLKDWFDIKNAKYIQRAKITLHSIGIGFAISKVTLQRVSSYFMVLTASTGRSRGFYFVHHLRPYWRGSDVQAMYLGALFWLIACVFVFLAWILALYYDQKIPKEDEEDRLAAVEGVPPPWGDNEIVPPDLERVNGDVGSGHAGERVDPALDGFPEGEVEKLLQHRHINIEEADHNERVVTYKTLANIISEGDMNKRSNSSDSETLLGQGTFDSQLSSTTANEPIVQNVTPKYPHTTRAYENLPRDDLFKTPENESKEEVKKGQPPPEETLEQREAGHKKNFLSTLLLRLVCNLYFSVDVLGWICLHIGSEILSTKANPGGGCLGAASFAGLGVSMAAH
ncbi:hypothetical protein B0O99DRAFT_694163 [Bisporella sp. PMI_857]|nr:hypothetical protein B0O99DRAFT_694163 [Bisporella sp. PMI_857]